MGLAQVRPVIAANETGSASKLPFVYHDQMLTKAKSIEFCSDAEVMTWNPFCPYIWKDFSAFFFTDAENYNKVWSDYCPVSSLLGIGQMH